MYVYNGKLDWYDYAKNECITLVFPAGFALKDPVCAYWQWTADAKGVEKSNTYQLGAISSVTKTADEYRVAFSFEYYSFEVVVAPDLKSVTATMRNPAGDTSSALTLQAQLSDACRVPTTEVFIGKLNWFSYAVNEMVTLVVPGGIADGAVVGLYYQWTIDAAGKRKGNVCVNSHFREVSSSDGKTKATFGDGYYTYDITVASGSKTLTINMRNPSGNSVAFDVQQTDWRQLHQKRALIVRFGTGTDNGIFLARYMLVKNLGFDPDDVEMLYFSAEPKDQPGVLENGREPPTASNFKAKFTNLIAGATAGAVRFVYVDTHGTIYPGGGSPTKATDIDEGWTMAQDDGGLQKETIRENLAPGVNLTILTSACVGAAMLNTEGATAGVLLTGCHETQFNCKALRTKDGKLDPWMSAIATTIDYQVAHKRGVPAYATLFNAAKKFIQQELTAGALSGMYRGASVNERDPTPRDADLEASNQDPQLIFSSGYVDPGEEGFLAPFVAPRGGYGEGECVRFPKDEYPTGGEL
ncbi:hypothetical protein GGG16DRAFT_126442 [Schizophyllum commune]